MIYNDYTKEQKETLNELIALVEKMRTVMSEELIIANLELVKHFLLSEAYKNI